MLLSVADHLERELVVIAEKEPPLAVVGDGGRLRHDVGDGQAVLLAERHVDARHEGEMKRHVAFVAIAEVRTHIGGPLVGLGQHHAAGVALVDGGADGFDDGVGFGKILAGGAVALDQVRNRVDAQRVHAHVEPEAHHAQHFFQNLGAVVVQVRLVGEEAMPVVGLGDRIPGPVGFFGVSEDDAGVFVLLVGVAPDVEIALGRSCRGVTRALEPWMLIGAVIDDQLDHHLQAAIMRRIEKALKLLDRSVARVDAHVVGDVVAIVAQGRGKEGQDPQAGHAEVLEVVELLRQPGKIADAVVVTVAEGLDVDLVDDRVLEPERVRDAARLAHDDLGFRHGVLRAHR